MMDAQEVPNYGVELVLPDQEPVSVGWGGWRQLPITERNIMFQKEAALNICVRHVPAEYTKIVVMDCDIMFENEHWLAQTSALLDHFSAVSPWRRAAWTDATGNIVKGANSLGTNPAGIHPGLRVHAGFSIALRRTFWNDNGVNGLYPYCIIGGGDVAVGAALAKCNPVGLACHVPELSDAYSHYVNRVGKWVNGIAYTDGIIYHEHHGDLADRKYDKRVAYIQGLIPEKHLKFTNDGLLEWTSAVPERIPFNLAQYFQSRKEDN